MEDLNPDHEIRCQIKNARSVFMKLKPTLTNKTPDTCHFNGCETCTLKTNIMNKSEAFEMWVYR